MERIRVNHLKKFYEIESIRQISENILQIIFINDIPNVWGNIHLYTRGGQKATTLSGYETIYRDEGQTIYLSNNGNVYKEPEPIIPSEPYVPTPEELLREAQYSKKSEISNACERKIFDGVSVTLADGTIEHYSLTEHDQINLFGKQVQLAAGAETLEYHADGQPFRYYSAADMQSIIQAAMWHVSYHTTYCNALNMWIAGCQTADDVWSIFYGADVPKEYRSEVLNTYLLQLDAIGEENETRS
jgi:hypothetical protein